MFDDTNNTSDDSNNDGDVKNQNQELRFKMFREATERDLTACDMF